jgi:hypothetical protein
MARAPGSSNSPHPPQRPGPKSILNQQLALSNKIAHQPLTLQLRSVFDVSLLCCGLMSASPDGPGDDVSGADAPLGQPHRDASDLLNRPADQLEL